MLSEGKEYILSLDIGGTNLRIGMGARNYKLYNYTCEKNSLLDLDDLKSYIAKNIKKNPIGSLIAIAIGFPSTVSKNKKIVYSSPNIEGFDNINVADPLENMFHVPVFIDRDVNFLLEYEIITRHLTNQGILLGFYIGTGFGNSIYINGQFLSGKNGVAAEIGHIPVLNNLLICNCGNEGCVETIASGKRLEELKQIHFADTNIKEIFKKHGENPILKDFVRAIAIPIATEINIFDPDHIIIGGGVIHMKNFPIQFLEKYIHKQVRKPFPELNLDISYAKSKQETGVLGGAYYVYERLKK
jgi:allose kinase